MVTYAEFEKEEKLRRFRGDVKYYFADFVPIGGGNTPQIRNPLFAENFVHKGGRGYPSIRNSFLAEEGGMYPPYRQNPQSSI